jgi:hypothetical protein
MMLALARLPAGVLKGNAANKVQRKLLAAKVSYAKRFHKCWKFRRQQVLAKKNREFLKQLDNASRIYLSSKQY